MRRKELNLSQSDLANMSGLRQASISDIEKGKVNYTIASLIAILCSLRCELQIESKEIDSIPGFDKPGEN